MRDFRKQEAGSGSPHRPPLLTDPDYCTHFFFLISLQKRETRELSLTAQTTTPRLLRRVSLFLFTAYSLLLL